MYRQYRDQAAFYIVYIEEAHANDVWQAEENLRQNLLVSAPRTLEERSGVADSCVRNLHIEIPAVVDNFRNTTERAYTGWPDRLYVIDRSGQIAYKSKPGPYGFRPKEMEAVLQKLL